MRTHRIALVAYDGFQLLDVCGPAAVFAAANDALGRKIYDTWTVSPRGGPVASSSGVTIATRPLANLSARKINTTLLIAGGDPAALRSALAAPEVRQLIPRLARRSARFGSVCSGTFVLAALGLLEGKRVATHWVGCHQLAAMYPKLTVDADALYVVDGAVWTSAGVTTGIDMALAMVEQDIGADIANVIAKRLVLYARRPGYQSQFSPLLQAQLRADTPFAELIEWMHRHLEERLDISALAARAGLSERTFYRKFIAATGQTPAHFVETLRLDAARTLLARDLSFKAIANKVGFSSATRLTAAFDRRFGITLKLFREMHTSNGNRHRSTERGRKRPEVIDRPSGHPSQYADPLRRHCRGGPCGEVRPNPLNPSAVGAVPQHPTGLLGYAFNWSPEGVVMNTSMTAR
jgi:transcriptional regulator GlxA family with amidase domain